jgi:hypothetical protein
MTNDKTKDLSIFVRVLGEHSREELVELQRMIELGLQYNGIQEMRAELEVRVAMLKYTLEAK